MTAGEGRKFAFTVGAAFVVLAGISYWRGHRIPVIVLAALGALLLFAGLVAPAKLGPVQRGWMGLAERISRVTTPIFMGLVYFVVLTPVGLIMRAVGRRPLEQKEVDGSYWVRRPEGRRSSDLSRQF